MRKKLIVVSISILLIISFISIFPCVGAVENTPPRFKTGWVEVADKLGDANIIYSLAVCDGSLYGGTGYGATGGGKLYKWNDVGSWIELAGQVGERRIYSLAVYNGSLYGGTGTVDGKLYKWNDVDSWIEVAGKLGNENQIFSLAVYGGSLYGGTGLHGKLYKWNDVNSWIEVAGQLDETIIQSLAVYNGSLYGGTGHNGKLYKWNDVDSWIQVADKLGDESDINSLAVYDGSLYGGTNNNGKLYKWNDVDSWIEVADKLGNEITIKSLAVYDGSLYGGTARHGKLYKWNDVDSWIQVADTFGGEIGIFSLAVYNGSLYGGTGETSGSLYKFFYVTSPYYNQKQIPITTTLKIHVIDKDCDTMSVSFYWDDDTLIEMLTNIDTDTIAETSSLSLDYETTYNWYAIANDSLSQTQSDVFTFTTLPNTPPDKPDIPKIYNIVEDFSSSWLPTDWEEIIHSGNGEWEKVISDTFNMGYFPYDSTLPYASASNFEHPTQIFNVSLFTPKFNANSNSDSIYLNCGVVFYLTDSGNGYIQVWSNNKTNLEETLEHGEGEYHINTQLDLINYSSINDIQIEFYYTTDNTIGQYFYSVDNVMIYERPVIKLNVSTSTTLKVNVSDTNSDTMTVSFYWSDDTLIETVTDVQSNTVAETSTLRLDSNTTYNWYAIANDSLSQTQSDVFTFTTVPNYSPNKPTCVSPTDEEENVSINTKLKVHVIDMNNETMTVSFYWNNDTLIETITGVQNNTDAETSSLSLDYLTQYDWYAIANDSELETKSDIFTFSTSENAMPVFEHVIPVVLPNGYLFMIYRNDNINVSNLNLLMGSYSPFSVWKFNYTSQDWDIYDFIINTNDYIRVKINESDLPYKDTLIRITPQIRFKISDVEDDELDIIVKSNSSGSWEVVKEWSNVSEGWFTCEDNNMDEYNTTYYYSINVTDSYDNNLFSIIPFTTTSTEPSIPPITPSIDIIYIIGIILLIGIGGSGVYILSPKKRKRIRFK